MSDFNLVYYHRETGKTYKVKRVTMHDYIIMDPETEAKIPISRHFLNKTFRADKGNSKRQNGHRTSRLNFKKFKKVKETA